MRCAEGEALKILCWLRHNLAGRQSPFLPLSLDTALTFPVLVSCGLLWSGVLPHVVCMLGMTFCVVITVCWALLLPGCYLSSVTGLGTSFSQSKPSCLQGFPSGRVY